MLKKRENTIYTVSYKKIEHFNKLTIFKTFILKSENLKWHETRKY